MIYINSFIILSSVANERHVVEQPILVVSKAVTKNIKLSVYKVTLSPSNYLFLKEHCQLYSTMTTEINLANSSIY